VGIDATKRTFQTQIKKEGRDEEQLKIEWRLKARHQREVVIHNQQHHRISSPGKNALEKNTKK